MNWVAKQHWDFVINKGEVFVRCQVRKMDAAPELRFCNAVTRLKVPKPGETAESKCVSCKSPLGVKFDPVGGVHALTPVQ